MKNGGDDLGNLDEMLSREIQGIEKEEITLKKVRGDTASGQEDIALEEIKIELERIKVELVIEVYKAYLDDTHELRDERQTMDNIRVTIVTLFLGAQAYVASSVFSTPLSGSVLSLSISSWFSVVAAISIGGVGYYFW